MATNSEIPENNKYQTMSNMEIDDLFEVVETRLETKSNHLNKPEQTEYDLIKEMGFNFNYECDESNMANLEPNDKHTILFDHLSFKCNDHVGPPRALPKETYQDQWNDFFVKMPFSDSNTDRYGNKRWLEIKRVLSLLAEVLPTDPDSIHIENAIKQNNTRYRNSWNFDAMHSFFNEILTKNQSQTILRDVLPKMIKLALDLPNKICQPIPILKQGVSHSISLSQEQCGSILANALFCTFPNRNYSTNPAELPFINFSSLYGGQGGSDRIKIEKLKCIFHYFTRITAKMPEGILTFKRQFLADHDIPDFKNSTKNMRKVLIRLDGTIEDCACTLQLDFANKFLGGGVLNSGCVQEEIRFMICPELLVSMLFIKKLQTNETVIIKGCERFSSYTGYAGTFQWAGDYSDETARDGWNRLHTHVLAMDALHFRSQNQNSQFQEAKVHRELKKCYSGFKYNNDEMKTNKNVLITRYPAIATGNWGCGAFNGDKQLKFLIQLMAASETERDLIYFTFNELSLVSELNKIVNLIESSKLDVSQIYAIINDYSAHLSQLNLTELENLSICKFMEEKLTFST